MSHLQRLSPSIFRAYDIRGEYPREVNAYVVETVAAAIGSLFPPGPMIVAHDGRTSSPALAFAVLRGLASVRSRARLIDLGTTTTPMFYFFVERLKAAGGIMVTASHNPKTMNGLKVVGAHAVMIPGTELAALVHKKSHAQNA